MKMDFTPNNKAAEAENFPKLKLSQDETARIAVYEAPDAAYVHNIRKPKLLNGEVQYKQVKTQNGMESQMDFDFVGNPICLGDWDTITERGIDPKNCPACKAAQESPDQFQGPKRRFAMHVFQYNTNGTSKATKNFQGTVKVWSFTDQKFAEIVDLKDEAPEQSLDNIDLILGPCENAMFQKYKIIAGSNVKWKETDNTRAQFSEIIEENRAKDLRRFLGRSAKADWITDQIDQVRRAWKQANGQKDERADDGLASAEPNFDAGLKNLLDSPSTKPSTAPASDEAVDIDTLLKEMDI